MKKSVVSFLISILVVTLGMTASAAFSSSVIPYADKIPISTPNFVPKIDGIKDAGYTVDTPVNAPSGDLSVVYENVTVSTAWNENTLYFYIYVPDTTPQTTVADVNMFDLDGVWFLLDFGGERQGATMWKTQKSSKVFKILPAVEQALFVGAVYEESIQPVRDEDLQYKALWDENGYGLEVAYTVPAATSVLAVDQEIAFELEVFDVNIGNNTWYRFHINNTNQSSVENFCTAWSAKLMLEEAPPPVEDGTGSPETSDTAFSLAIMMAVSAMVVGVALKKKNL